jgi:hypothetical protein
MVRRSGSQEERVTILRVALTLKGVPSGAHYDIDRVASEEGPAPGSNARVGDPLPLSTRRPAPDSAEDTGGIDL